MATTTMVALACSCLGWLVGYSFGAWRGYMRGHRAAAGASARAVYIAHAAAGGQSPEAIATAIREVEGQGGQYKTTNEVSQ